jgi:hypothetical protein
MTDNEMLDLREGIRKKYEAYHLAKPGKYPSLKFNSYPAPYEHLRACFIDELTRQGKADMQEALAAIPGNKTFAKIFYEGYILKDEKVLDACYLYAWGQSREVTLDGHALPAVPDEHQPATSTKRSLDNRIDRNKVLLGGLLVVTGLLVYVAIGQQRANPYAHGLVFSTPAAGDTVPRIMLARGEVTNAGTVWIVIRSAGRPEYYVQAPIKVNADGAWEGPIYTGNSEKACIGLRFQLRAFVNPAKALTADEVIFSWPEAEISSDVVEVMRGARDTEQSPTP